MTYSSAGIEGHEYDELDECFLQLVEDLGLSEFPVDCYEVADRLRIEIHAYSELPEDSRLFAEQKYKDGFSCFTGSGYRIYYNDAISAERRRFTFWYEIGHIVLGHFEDSSKTSERKKAECNHFAAYAQAPMPFVMRENPKSWRELAEIFCLSDACARNIFTAYSNARRNPAVRDKILSSRIFSLFEYQRKNIAVTTA